MVSDKVINKLASKYHVNLHVLSVELLKYATIEELEHKDVIGKSNDKAFRIALKHLEEFPDYYHRLQRMVDQADKYWSKHKKPNIYNNV